MSSTVNNEESDYSKKVNDRLSLGHAWMMCIDCGAKLYDFDGYKDRTKSCPYVRDEQGQCTDELKYV